MERTERIGMTEGRISACRELLSSTTFKDGLRLFLKDIDPGSGPELVRTLMGTDVEVPMALVSTLPVVANTLIGMAMELVLQVRGRYPAPLLAGMAASLLQDVDRDTLASLIREARKLGRDLAPALSAFARAVEERSSAGEEVA